MLGGVSTMIATRFNEALSSFLKASDFSMILFRTGRRGCPGASMAIPTIELALAQLLHTFEWNIEGNMSQLNMNEAYGISIAREVSLCAYPRLKYKPREGSDTVYVYLQWSFHLTSRFYFPLFYFRGCNYI